MKFRIEYANGDFDVVRADCERDVWVEFDGEGDNEIISVIPTFCDYDVNEFAYED